MARESAEQYCLTHRNGLKSCCRYVEVVSHFHIILRYIASFVDQATMYPAWSPACFVTKELKLLETEWDTHTQRRIGSLRQKPE